MAKLKASSKSQESLGHMLYVVHGVKRQVISFVGRQVISYVVKIHLLHDLPNDVQLLLLGALLRSG